MTSHTRTATLTVGTAALVVAPASAFGMASPVPAATEDPSLGSISSTEISSASVTAASDYWDCWSETGARHGPYPERFATFYGKSYAKGRVVHNDGTSHSVGVGVKAPGGSWGQARTDSVRATGVGYDSAYTIADAHVFNKIYQRYYYAKCRSRATGEVETTTTTKPAGFASGPHYSYAGHVDYSTCSPTYANHTYSRTSYTNGTYSAGLDLPFVNLSAQSGWTTSTAMHWKFTKAGKLCGNGSQWGQASRVSAK